MSKAIIPITHTHPGNRHSRRADGHGQRALRRCRAARSSGGRHGVRAFAWLNDRSEQVASVHAARGLPAEAEATDHRARRHAGDLRVPGGQRPRLTEDADRSPHQRRGGLLIRPP